MFQFDSMHKRLVDSRGVHNVKADMISLMNAHINGKDIIRILKIEVSRTKLGHAEKFGPWGQIVQYLRRKNKKYDKLFLNKFLENCIR